MPLILASASPRREEIVKRLKIPFQIEPARIKEIVYPLSCSVVNATQLSLKKALQTAQNYPQSWVLAADTVVAHQGEILQKPKNQSQAKEMIQKLSGNMHQVVTGICLHHKEKQQTVCDYRSTRVTFRKISQEEIERYILTEDPYDKAGGYGIQSQGALFVEKIEGDYYNVMGLPLVLIYTLLKTYAPELWQEEASHVLSCENSGDK